MATAPNWLHKVIEENSTKRFHIEYDYKGYDLSNHMAHGIIALWWLGANESRIHDFAKHYEKTIDPPNTDDLGAIDDPEALLGKRIRYNDLMKLYQDRLQNYGGDLRILVQKEFPRLSAGLYNAVLHPFIHLGYGYSVKSERVVCEGLAYLHHSYRPVGQVDDPEGPDLKTLGKGSQNILDVLNAVVKNTSLNETVLKESTGPESRKMNPFQDKVGAFVDFHSEEVFNYVHSIKFPDFWDPENLSQDQVKRIAEWVLDCALTVYIKAKNRNDFIYLHGVTASWSLCQILPLLTEDKEILKTLRVFLSSILGIFLAHPDPLDADEEIVKDFPPLIKECVAEERDEHIHKMVQVCHARYLDESSTSKDLYLKGAHVALNHHLYVPK